MIVMIDQITEINLIRALNEQNIWWKEGIPPEKFARKFRRRDFYPTSKELEKKEITAIIGQRQVGKTTLLYQLIEYLIKEKNIDPSKILFFSFDNPYVGITRNKTSNLINDILDVFSVNILKQSFSKTEQTVYVFFDEISKYPNWSEILKGWYDLKYPIKFVVSDSSSSSVLKGVSESLVGRIKIQIMLSFKFLDFVKYKMPSSIAQILNQINLDLREKFLESMIIGAPNDTFDFLKMIYSDLSPIENDFKTYLRTYMIKDGFPELIDIDSLDECRKKLYDYISLTLQKDLLRIFQIRNPRALEDLVAYIAAESSQRFIYENTARNLAITNDTLKEYMDYLESVFLISRAEFYSKSRAARIRKSNKIYLNNIGLRNVLVNKLTDDLFTDSKDVGKVAETLVHDHCKRLKFCLELTPNPELFYWNDKKDNEVDIIFEIQNKLIPIEVKYQNTISNSDLKGIKAFLSQYKTSSFGLLVTKDLLDLKDGIIFVPLWMFLLIC
jgi:predicted AAA+ superfamily ATPase